MFFSSCRRGGGSPRPDDDKPKNKRGDDVTITSTIGISHEWDKICCKLNPNRGHEETTAICPECHERHKIADFTKVGICKSCVKERVRASRQAKRHIHKQSQ